MRILSSKIWISEFFSKLFSKVSCYLQSEKIWIVVLQNYYMFAKTTTCIRLQTWQIFSVNIWYTYFSILGMALAVPFLCYFQKLQHLVVKELWTNFCCVVLLYLWIQKVCLRFLKFCFKLEILIFLSFVVSFFSRYVQLKSFFSDKKKHHQGHLRHTLAEKILTINVAEY